MHPSVNAAGRRWAVTLLLGGLLGPAAAAPNSAAVWLGAPGGSDSAPAVAVSAAARGASYHGRSLSVRELSVAGSPAPWLQLSVGSQDIVAHVQGTARFETKVTTYGARVSLLGSRNARQDLAVSYEHLQTGVGKATTSDEYAAFTGVRAETYAVSYRPPSGRLVPEFRADYSDVRGGTQRAQVVGGAASAVLPLGNVLAARLTGSIFHGTGDAGDATNTVFAAAVAYSPVAWATLEAGLDVAPRGLPVAGTPLTGLSSFLIYQPGGAAQEVTNRAVGFGTIRLVLSHQF